jgi:hypothetical protein
MRVQQGAQDMVMLAPPLLASVNTSETEFDVAVGVE